jgi:Raf kinase inhibitor-like YbhB/YbcL family protein
VTAASGEPAVTFAIHTNAFEPGGEIPAKYTCSGADVSPALSWAETPAHTQALALLVDDPDAPGGTFTHWVLYNLGPQERELREGIPKVEQLPSGALQGRNDFRKIGYGGPCPPPGKPHRYFFKLYALDAKLNLRPGASKSELEKAMKGHILGQSELMGKFQR